MAILRVPLDYPTIQAAIDAAAIGDGVEVADGYTGPLVATVDRIASFTAPASLAGITLTLADGFTSEFAVRGRVTILGSDDANAVHSYSAGAALCGGGGDDVFSLYGYGEATVIGGEGYDTLNLRSSGLDKIDVQSIEELRLMETWASIEQLSSFTRIRGLNLPSDAISLTLQGAGGTLDLASRLVDGTDVRIRSEAENVKITLKDGDDYVVAQYGNNTLDGGAGDDQLSGGYLGNNVLFGRDGDDSLIGGRGNDHIYGGRGVDNVLGGDGLDYVRYDDADYGDLVIDLSTYANNTGAAAGDIFWQMECIVSGVGNDSLIGDGASNRLFGGGGNDTVRGGAGFDHLDGGDGDDHLYGGTGADRHVGGAGFDYVRYDDADYGNLTIRLDAPQTNTGVAKGDTYSGIEGIVGGAGRDLIFGDGEVNRLLGGAGNDMIDGRGGSDRLQGGAGTDAFRFSTALGPRNVDTIADFEHGVDRILLHRAIFADVGATLEAQEFGLAPGAGRFIVYEQNTGRLLYDAGGSGEGAGPVLFAVVTPGTVLDVGDFAMI